jgi:hypothetical protein
VGAFYALVGVHLWAWSEVVLVVLRKRLGVTFGLIWVGIGTALLYNVLYNHFFAMIIKPGSPQGLRVTTPFFNQSRLNEYLLGH